MGSKDMFLSDDDPRMVCGFVKSQRRLESEDMPDCQQTPATLHSVEMILASWYSS